jgi:hypothetical protein
MSKLRRLPELGDLKQIPVPDSYRGADPQRIRDYLEGFQMAYEIAQQLQDQADSNE